MPNLKIKQLDDRVSTSGVHMGGGPERRKLEPGEIVAISEDVLTEGGRVLAHVLMETGKLEITLEDATRPLDYESYREAELCAPNFRPHDTSEEAEAREAAIAVARRLALGKKPAQVKKEVQGGSEAKSRRRARREKADAQEATV